MEGRNSKMLGHARGGEERAEEGDPKEGKRWVVEGACSVLLHKSTADNPQLVGAKTVVTVVTSTVLTSPTHQAPFEMVQWCTIQSTPT